MSSIGSPYAISSGINPAPQLNVANNQQSIMQRQALMQAQQQAMQQQQMAQALQGQQSQNAQPQMQQPNMNASYGGMANGANQVLNTYNSPQGPGGQQKIQNAIYASQGISPVNVTPNQMTGMGGSNSMAQNAAAYLKNLFSLGGSS